MLKTIFQTLLFNMCVVFTLEYQCSNEYDIPTIVTDLNHESTKNTNGDLHLNLSGQSLMNLDLSDIGDRVVILNLSWNNLSVLKPNMFSYLPRLRVLNVSHNLIVNVPTKLFVDNPCLESIDLSHNAIRKIPSGVLGSPGQTVPVKYFDASHNLIHELGLDLFHEGLCELFVIDFSYNKLKHFEPWPYRIKCRGYLHTKDHIFNCSHNEIKQFTNKMEHYVDKEQNFVVDLNFNQITKLNDLRKFSSNLSGNYTVYNIVMLRITMADNPWLCDCGLYQFTELVLDSFIAHHPQIYNYMRCYEPLHLRNKSLDYILNNQNVLLCNLTGQCPRECLCQYRPKLADMFVDCSNNNLTKMPKFVPKVPKHYTQSRKYKISLDLSYNYIKYLSVDYYNSYIKSLDISRNQLSDIDPQFFAMTSQLQSLNINNNAIKSLPSTIQGIPNNMVDLDKNPLRCSCGSLWFNDWLRLHPNNVTCLVGESVFLGNSVTYTSIQCYQDILLVVCLVLAAVIVFVIIGMTLYYKWRYQTKVLFYYFFGILSVRQKKDSEYEKSKKRYSHDVYISANNDNFKTRSWIRHNLLKRLEQFGFECYYSPRDEPAGACIVDILPQTILATRNFLVILDVNYLKNNWCLEEFDHAHHVKLEEGGKIVVLVIDESLLNESDDIQHKAIKTYITQDNIYKLSDKLIWPKLKYELSVL